MSKTVLTLGSVTYAIKSRKLLVKSGIKSKLIKIDSTGGCTYGIEFDRDKFYTVVKILRDADLEYKVYRE